MYLFCSSFSIALLYFLGHKSQAYVQAFMPIGRLSGFFVVTVVIFFLVR
jgi:hypothetical protein